MRRLMEFRILGPVEVVDQGRVVALGPSKQRALLADLLLHLNEVVSRDRLIEDLWGERAPETAATALHGYVSQLRKLLETSSGADHRVLVTRAPGYLLELDPGQVDLKRFELLARRGRRELASGEAEAAAATLADALALWRGPPLAEFNSAPFAPAESLRLQERRISALEDRIEADLELGRHADLCGELETLVAEHPFRERLCGQLMLALYRCGRQAEALDVYRKTRRKLVEELGIEPGPGLQELEQAILRHDLAAAPVAGTTTFEGAVRAAQRWRLPAVAALGALAVAIGLTFALGARHRPSIRLAPNSVGFIDAGSSRVTRAVSVGRKPLALAVAFKSLWVAEYTDETVSRVDRTTGSVHNIPVGGHPTGITVYRGTIWVWTMEGLLVAINPRYDSASRKIQLGVQPPAGASTEAGPPDARLRGRIAGAGGFLWITAPEARLIQVNAANPRRHHAFIPDDGTQGPIAAHAGLVWVGGFKYVTPIDARTGVSEAAIAVGRVRALSFGLGTLWAASGSEIGHQGVPTALRRLDLRGRLVQAELPGVSDPTAVAVAAGSVWAANASGTIVRVDPRTGQVVGTVRVGPSPRDLAPDGNGVWVAVD